MALDMQKVDLSIENIEILKDKIRTVLKEQLSVEISDQENKQTVSKFTIEKDTLKQLNIAVIMDEFTFDCYTPECNLCELTPDGWKSEIEEFKPNLLFVESAWQGKDKLWYRKIANGSKEYFDLASYCRLQGIPVVFWNKEDPIYTDVFMPAARMADFVFTTDVDCIPKYKAELGHENIFHLHFAAQPKVHNPLEKYVRKDKFCFAGAYYHRYQQRAKVFDEFAKVFISMQGLDIYDRNYKNALPEHAFPAIYNPYILGRLEPKEIDKAYKGYVYGINMNSVNQSQSMFARRVFEMLASNTITVGNYARGLKNYFGDLTICTDDEVTLTEYLDKYCCNEETCHKYRLQGLRKVLKEHLYEDRLDYMVQKIFGKSMKRRLPCITVIISATDENKVRRLQRMYDNQSYENRKLVILTVHDENRLVHDFVDDGFIAYFNEEDYYGINYLQDMILTLRYYDANVIGKAKYYKNDEKGIVLSQGESYTEVSSLSIRRSIISRNLLKKLNMSIFDLLNKEEIEANHCISIDEFNYCENFSQDVCEKVDDISITDIGLPITQMNETVEKIKKVSVDNSLCTLRGHEILEKLKESCKGVTISEKDNNCHLDCDVEDKQYIYLNEKFPVQTFTINHELRIAFHYNCNISIIGTCTYYDQKNRKISSAFTKSSSVLVDHVPNQAAYFTIGLRVSGHGSADLEEIVIQDTQKLNAGLYISNSDTLIVTNQYPSKDNLYKNMFVHKRVKEYKKLGYNCDVARINIYADSNYREFEGVNVIEGNAQELNFALSNGQYKTICIHFLDNLMWNVIKNFANKVKVIIWVHGSDIQPWWRRKCLYETNEEIEKAKRLTKEKMDFWYDVFGKRKEFNLHFVFVSNIFFQTVEEDYNIKFEDNEYSIIPNCIDTELFAYREKPVEQRNKIISIRPYASKIYGNDLTVKTIKTLAKTKCFKQLSFLIIGDGILFKKTVKPLRKYKNVQIINKFLRQEEIAKLYSEYGVALIPTRGDTQGVSRDEAMSCGVVPVTNSVAAIPEFVDNTCGIVVPEEDYIQMAKEIEKINQNPDYFKMLSTNAANRVRRQSSKNITISKELDVMIR